MSESFTKIKNMDLELINGSLEIYTKEITIKMKEKVMEQ